jgi:oxygen-dependent protoporphyrinogen oxidase
VNPAGNASLPIAIIGGGITGLTAAHRLVRQGKTVRIFEASSRLGGSIRSERAGDWLIEAGPNSLQQTPAVAALLGELDLEAATLPARPEAKNRYLVRNGRLLSVPASPPALLASKLFSTGAKLRLLREIFSRPRTRPADVSLTAFVESHFGRELVDYGLSPFVSGVYAGDSDKLSARHSFPSLWAMEQSHGSIIRGQIAAAKARRARGEPAGPAPIISFADGLETLPRALAARLPAGTVELHARVTTLVPPSADRPWQVEWTSADSGSPPRSQFFSAVLLALPAAALAQLTIGTHDQRPLASLADIEYPPVSSLFLGYRTDQIDHPLDGFGLLVPPIEHRPLLGVLFNSTLFPGRAPEEHVALTVMTGGSRNPDLARLTDEALLALVRDELASLLGMRGDPVFVRRTVWPRAIPQYTLGYERFLDTMTRAEQAHPGLFIGGHVRDGISLPACIAAGEKLAARVSSS